MPGSAGGKEAAQEPQMEPERYQEKADELASAETAMDLSELVSVTEERTAELEHASPEKLANVNLADPDADTGDQPPPPPPPSLSLSLSLSLSRAHASVYEQATASK